MAICWGGFSTKSKKALKTGWLITSGVLALYLGVIQPREQARGIASEKATGLAAVGGGVGWEPLSLWHQTSILPHFARTSVAKDIVGGASVDRAVVMNYLVAPPASRKQQRRRDRRLVSGPQARAHCLPRPDCENSRAGR
jgi:hypothetical protein